tara:strand:+ start:334 stop:498 length:165 start_codon:yes stop_codon:yes gene_type:complete
MYAICAISISSICYAVTSIACIKDKDYPHALMWFAYSMANIGLLWYEIEKRGSA